MEEIMIPDPAWGSDLANIILDLEKLRTKRLGGDVPPYIFFQLKETFQILETLGSARIEGNNTTLADYVENLIAHNEDESTREIRNLEKAIAFIEQNTDSETVIDRAYISHLHKILTEGLSPPPSGEGSRYPGELRKLDVSINKSGHRPPSPMLLQECFDRFVSFINKERKEQYQLLMVAIAHHRFEYIHPFDNGNGRMGRLLNYAFLIKLDFQVKNGRILNPSSVFYSDRDKYYRMLSRADTLKDDDLLAWCEYFLLGLKNEIEKIDSLLYLDYVRDELLFPMLELSRKRAYIDEMEYKILRYIVGKEEMAIKSSELSRFGIEDSKKKAYLMSKLKKKNIVTPLKDGGRVYTIVFENNYLLRSLIEVLRRKGFVSDFLNG